jgi:GNAT superfamily N-acetyltransferase
VSVPSSSQERLFTALEFQHRTNELVADECRRIDEGWVIRTPSRPALWMLNQVRVSSQVGSEQAAGLCRRHLPEARFDQLHVDERAGGQWLAETFGRQGWEVEVEVHSVLVGQPDRRVDTTPAIEPGEDEALALMERWVAEDQTLKLTEDGLRQLVEANRAMWRARGARRLGIRDPDGRLAAIALLFSDGRVAQVEDVYTVPESRGRGYARVLVSRAIELARTQDHELTFIVADDNDWPKQLYWRLGFEPVGRSWLFHRDL